MDTKHLKALSRLILGKPYAGSNLHKAFNSHRLPYTELYMRLTGLVAGGAKGLDYAADEDSALGSRIAKIDSALPRALAIAGSATASGMAGARLGGALAATRYALVNDIRPHYF